MDKRRKRKLPDWMLGIPVKKEDGTTASVQVDVSKLINDSLPLFVYPRPAVYCYNIDDCCLLCDDILEMLSGVEETVAGFDLEWPVTYQTGQVDKTVVLQLCLSEQNCYVFHLSCMQGLPSMLKEILLCPKLKLSGIGIECDLWKLERDFDIQVRPIIHQKMVDLGHMANRVLRSSEKWSLENLTKHLFKERLSKDESVRKGDWSCYPLSDKQLLYAATDAYACWKIYRLLIELEGKTT